MEVTQQVGGNWMKHRNKGNATGSLRGLGDDMVDKHFVKLK
jgi:hypothetical protein